MRLLIAGVPRAGKTTLAALRADEAMRAGKTFDVRHTDDLIADYTWSGASEVAATWLDRPGNWVIEGVALPRAIRKWLAAHRDGTPCDEIVWMPRPMVSLTPGQAAMAKGCETVWAEILPELQRRGVTIDARRV